MKMNPSSDLALFSLLFHRIGDACLSAVARTARERSAGFLTLLPACSPVPPHERSLISRESNSLADSVLSSEGNIYSANESRLTMRDLALCNAMSLMTTTRWRIEIARSMDRCNERF